jgi:hypothetical protein
MSAPATSILVLVAVLCVVGVTRLAITSARLRSEIQDLLRSFDRTERTLVPLVVTVRTDRDRLAERLEHLSDPARPSTFGSHPER